MATNILMNTRKGVIRDLGIGSQADPTWARTVAVEPAADVWRDGARRLHDEDPFGPASARDLYTLLHAAVAKSVLSPSGIALLLTLAEAADRADPARSGRGNAGLMSPAASDAVAITRGVTGRTVRRHAARSFRALRSIGCAADQRVSA